MNNPHMKTNPKTSASRGFTLIELLIVIAIIAILAALLFPAGAKIMQVAAKKRAQAELERMDAAINSYKLKLGYYPPDTAFSSGTNTLYFELAGCSIERNSSGQVIRYVSLDKNIGATPAQLGTLGATGIMNASSPAGSDDGIVAQSFLKEIKDSQMGNLGSLAVLGVQIDGPQMVGQVSLFRYNSSNPQHNKNSFDLWVDILLGGKTNRINNWGPPIKL